MAFVLCCVFACFVCVVLSLLCVFCVVLLFFDVFPDGGPDPRPVDSRLKSPEIVSIVVKNKGRIKLI